MPDESQKKSIQGKWLLDICCDFVREYVFQSLEVVNETVELEEKSNPPFRCRVENCNKCYVSHSVRVRFVYMICISYGNWLLYHSFFIDDGI